MTDWPPGVYEVAKGGEILFRAATLEVLAAERARLMAVLVSGLLASGSDFPGKDKGRAGVKIISDIAALIQQEARRSLGSEGQAVEEDV